MATTTRGRSEAPSLVLLTDAELDEVAGGGSLLLTALAGCVKDTDDPPDAGDTGIAPNTDPSTPDDTPPHEPQLTPETEGFA
jgi:hypothetical protein